MTFNFRADSRSKTSTAVGCLKLLSLISNTVRDSGFKHTLSVALKSLMTRNTSAIFSGLPCSGSNGYILYSEASRFEF
jgi:hypothetical protein